jgi:hypothetical protein
MDIVAERKVQATKPLDVKETVETDVENTVEDEVRDARPALPISDRSLWDRAARRRDQIAELIDTTFQDENYNVWIRKSKPGVYPLYVVVESWLPVAETELTSTFDRSSLKITIEVEPYRQKPLLYSVKLDRHAKKLDEVFWELRNAEIKEIALYLLYGGSKPTFFLPRVPLFERILGSFLPFIGRPPRNDLIDEAKPNHLTLPSMLGWGGSIGTLLMGGLSIAAIDTYNGPHPILVLLLIASVSAVIVAFYLKSQRPNVDAIPKQPTRSPRREFQFDSWHVSVPGAGSQIKQFSERIHAAIERRAPGIDAQLELHQHITPVGFEERERLVLTRNQSTLHIHIYPFGDNAFVGWESYLNWHRWQESEAVTNTVRGGHGVVYRSLAVGTYLPNDFDLIDVEVLAETVHSIIVDEVKAFLKESEKQKQKQKQKQK